MSIHRDFPISPFEIIDPKHRWKPDSVGKDSELSGLLPPFVEKIREEVITNNLSIWLNWKNSTFHIFDDLVFWFFGYPENEKITTSKKCKFCNFFFQNSSISLISHYFASFLSPKSISFIKILILCFR